ncbi:hypothetical protein [Chryseolinea lacunae]|uniref:Uncharacterized protein n=1 Tax=Chryseolinea lacunae TaxID=2801331 RepID=A0ABS1KZ53_9BACT|nr:hypothetical protein [Chryseolinea lacunae]MBL0744734.1 hypothetical protein [Chryseolinea lacunae]
MKTGLNKLLYGIALAACVLMTRCSSDDEQKPSAPLLTSDVSSLPIKFGETKSFTVSISAAGKVKDITATTDKGTVTVTEVTGVGQTTGSAKINYTALFEAGSAKITVVMNDLSEQRVTKEVSVDITEQPPLELTAGDVEGVWGPSRTYIIRGDLKIPAGKTLTVKEGVTVIVEGDGSQSNSPGINVEGNFYSLGTADKPVRFTVAEAKRTKENIFAGLWGGILGTSTSQEMVVLYTTIEYAGAPAVAGSPIVNSGELEEGDPRFGLYFNNPNGKFVLMHSTVAYTKDDGMRINQGQLLVAYNTYYLNGKTGGEALNIKSGSVGDVAFNVFYQPATNGVKWSNSDDRTPQMDVNVYNNTAINGGWRQTKSGRGGSFNLEKGGRGKAYNNLVVNCRYGTRFPKSPDNPDVVNSAVGYNLYYGYDDVIAAEFYPTTGSIAHGDFETTNDVQGAKGENDPKFVNFDVTTFNHDAAKNADNLNFPPTMNLKLKTDSPALNKGKTTFTTKFSTHSVGGATYTVPAPAAYIGANGN